MTTGVGYREFIEQVRAASSIREVVGEYVQLNTDGRGLCPFHKESRPSFGVDEPGQYFICFGCKTAGDVFKFVGLMEGLPFHQVVESLARRAGLPVYQPQAQDRDREAKDQAALYVTEAVARYYHSALTAEAAAYFTQQRGLPAEFLEQFMIGWADGRACYYVEQALGSEWLGSMEYAGLATEVRNQMSWVGAGSHRDLFFERLIFPMFRRRQPVFLSGRALDDREPKYLHQRGEVPLYNEDAVGPETFVVEGTFDVLSLEAWNFRTTGLNGGARPGAIAKLQRVQRAYLCLDPDPAGFHATMALGLALWPRALVVSLPDGLDPNEFYRKRSKGEFEALVGQAVDPVRFAVGRVPVDSPPERLGEALDPAFRLLAGTNPLTSEGFLEGVIAPRFKMSKTTVKRCLAQIDLYARGVPTKCPACGTILTTRKPV